VKNSTQHEAEHGADRGRGINIEDAHGHERPLSLGLWKTRPNSSGPTASIAISCAELLVAAEICEHIRCRLEHAAKAPARPLAQAAAGYRDGGIRQESWRMGMSKKRRTYLPRIVGDKVMMPADLKRLHKYMLEVEHIGIISDEMREVVEELWPELAHKLPPKTPRG
jgi:hypothetical protein